MRSALTVLRHRHRHHVHRRHDVAHRAGFDQSLRDSISSLGPDTIYGREVLGRELRRRREVHRTVEAAEHDAAATPTRSSTSAVHRDGRRYARHTAARALRERVYYHDRRRRSSASSARPRTMDSVVTRSPVELGRFFNFRRIAAAPQGDRARPDGVSWRSSRIRIRSARRCGSGLYEYEVIGVLAKRPSQAASAGRRRLRGHPATRRTRSSSASTR